MNFRLRLTPRITLVFVLFAAALLAGVGWLSYNNGHTALQASATSELLSEAIQKETEINHWVDERLADLTTLAATPALREDVARLIAAPVSPAGRIAHDHLVANLRPSIGPQYLEMFVLDPASGKVMASTDAAQEGKSKKNDPYFINGRLDSYVKNPYLSATLRMPGMAVSTPIRSDAGKLLGVLVARLDLGALNAIVTQRTGLRRSDDAYLVNPASQFVTQPRFISTPAVLVRAVHSEAVKRCLNRNSGVVMAPDYRGIEAIIVYRWLPSRQLGLIVKMEQAEALAPAYAFGKAIILISGLALLLASMLAFGLARGISRPIRALQEGVARFGRGESDLHVPENSGDEVGMLAREFQQMAATISAKEAQLHANAMQLEQRVGERTAQLKEAKAEVEQAARANRNMMEYSQDVICSVDEAGRFISVSPACRGVWGYSPAELSGRLYIEMVHPDDVEKTNRAAAEIMDGHAKDSFENRYLRRDGSFVNMLWSAVWSEAENPCSASLATLPGANGMKKICAPPKKPPKKPAMLKASFWRT
jgi:PAS domain S-box-containing protein